MSQTPATTVAISGHRPALLSPAAPAIIRNTIRSLVPRYPAATWLAGGAIGADEIATDELLTLNQRVHLILPFAPHIQAARWTPAQRHTLLTQMARAARVEILRDRYHISGYHERNRRLVDEADLLVAFWTGARGGTEYTIREAHRRNVPVYWVQV